MPLIGRAQTTASQPANQPFGGKGTLSVGIGFGGGQQANDLTNSLHISPRIQYFVADRWSLSLDGRYEKKWQSFNHFLDGGLSTRYYFLQARRLGAYGQARATLGQTRDHDFYWGWCGVGLPDDYQSTRYHSKRLDIQAAVGTGLQYNVCGRLSLEAGVERVLLDTRLGYGYDLSNDGLNGAWRGNIGVNYRLR